MFSKLDGLMPFLAPLLPAPRLAQAAAEGRHGGRRPVISKDMMHIALGRRADGESVTSIAKGLTYKTASGQERTVSRRALYNAFKAYDADRSETP